ncbi:unnamed protein product [Phytomonas sp. Hart1]|nr:unnamed protein product [Phytomonas sp. Hart1]|eukprot:CCW66825.1 unnamed protein product [Phytomonas sp. isolate Hart1]
MLFEILFPIMYHSFALGLLLLLEFAFLWILMAINFVTSLLKDAGPVPPWMQLEPIEAFVEQEVQHILDQSIEDERTQDGSQKKKLPNANSLSSHKEGNDVGEAKDHAVRANLMMSAAQTQRMQQNGHHDDNFIRVEGFNMNEDYGCDGSGDGFDFVDGDNQLLEDQRDVSTVPNHEHLRNRRCRKRKHGLRVFTLLQVARNALDALHGDSESKALEVSFLLNYSFPCKICSVYKIMGTEHCAICMRCFSHKDLHFKCIGQCVGAGNHKYFVLFLLYSGLGMLESCVATLYCMNKDYTRYAIRHKLKSFFMLWTLMTGINSIGIFIFLWLHLHSVGCGDSTLGRIRRANRESVERFARRITPNGHYRPLFADEPETPPGTFNWDRLRTTVFGMGPWWSWFLPIRPFQQVPEEERESLFWVALGETVERQLRSVVDAAHQCDAENEEGGISVIRTLPRPDVPADVVFTHAAAARHSEEAIVNEPSVNVDHASVTEGISGGSNLCVPSPSQDFFKSRTAPG